MQSPSALALHWSEGTAHGLPKVSGKAGGFQVKGLSREERNPEGSEARAVEKPRAQKRLALGLGGQCTEAPKLQ